MKYLADTDILITHLRGKKKLDKEKIKRGVSISIITLGELLYGAHKSEDRERSLQVIYSLLSDLSIEVLNLSEEIMFEYAKVKAELETGGQRLDEFDLLIAATAKIKALYLLTRNTKHFQRIPGLKLA